MSLIYPSARLPGSFDKSALGVVRVWGSWVLIATKRYMPCWCDVAQSKGAIADFERFLVRLIDRLYLVHLMVFMGPVGSR